VDVGKLATRYGGGGHRGASTVQLAPDLAEQGIKDLLAVLKANQG
jgi:nanoRNase/pAp phosphatase (c-di-AMP/oligoRNAs hydrolase)